MNPGLLGETSPGVARGGEGEGERGNGHEREGDWEDQDR